MFQVTADQVHDLSLTLTKCLNITINVVFNNAVNATITLVILAENN